MKQERPKPRVALRPRPRTTLHPGLPSYAPLGLGMLCVNGPGGNGIWSILVPTACMRKCHIGGIGARGKRETGQPGVSKDRNVIEAQTRGCRPTVE